MNVNEITVRIGDGENDFVCFCPKMDLRSAVCKLMIPHLPPEQIKEHMDDFLAVGLTTDDIVEAMWSWQIRNNIPELLTSGIKPQDIVERIGNDRELIEKYFDLLLEYGADVNELLTRIGDDAMWYRSVSIMGLITKGADPNIIATHAIDGRYFDSGAIMQMMLEQGADRNRIIATIINNRQGYLLIDHYDMLNDYGEKIDLEELIYSGHISYEDVLTSLDELNQIGIKINAKKFAKMVARSKKCSYHHILRECGIE